MKVFPRIICGLLATHRGSDGAAVSVSTIFRIYCAGDLAGSVAPLIHFKIVSYSGEPLVQRWPPPCAVAAAPATPSDSAVETGLRSSRLFSGSLRSITFFTVDHVALNSVCVLWQFTQA